MLHHQSLNVIVIALAVGCTLPRMYDLPGDAGQFEEVETGGGSTTDTWGVKSAGGAPGLGGAAVAGSTTDTGVKSAGGASGLGGAAVAGSTQLVGGIGNVGGSTPTGGVSNAGGAPNTSGTGTTAGHAGIGGTAAAGGLPPSGGRVSGTGGGLGGPVGTIGDPCAPNGAYACAGYAQRGQLVCVSGIWQSNGSGCTSGTLCDTSSTDVGFCQPIVAECNGKNPGDQVCKGQVVKACGPDLVTATVVTTCVHQTCTAGACQGNCAPGETNSCGSCGDGTRSCSNGAWGNCTGGTEPTTWYKDVDNDGFGDNSGDPNNSTSDCAQPSHYVSNHDDCCDADERANPNQKEYFEVANDCGNFDYDCNHQDDLEPAGVQGSCTCANGCSCGCCPTVTVGGFTSKVDCGRPGNWITGWNIVSFTCQTSSGSACNGPITEERIQNCK